MFSDMFWSIVIVIISSLPIFIFKIIAKHIRPHFDVEKAVEYTMNQIRSQKNNASTALFTSNRTQNYGNPDSLRIAEAGKPQWIQDLEKETEIAKEKDSNNSYQKRFHNAMRNIEGKKGYCFAKCVHLCSKGGVYLSQSIVRIACQYQT